MPKGVYENIVGKVFKNTQGCDMLVIEELEYPTVKIRFLDDFRYERVAEKYLVKSGKVKNPYSKTLLDRGYIGVGEYSCGMDSRGREEYAVWRGIFHRCYKDGPLGIKPYYTNCVVSEKWFDFQNFAGWLEPKKMHRFGWLIDKDLLVRGNREYGPDFCCLLPCVLNNNIQIRTKKISNLPVGVGKSGNKFAAFLTKEYIGLFSTAEDAHRAYCNQKDKLIHTLAKEHRENLMPEAYDKLILWDTYKELNEN